MTARTEFGFEVTRDIVLLYGTASAGDERLAVCRIDGGHDGRGRTDIAARQDDRRLVANIDVPATIADLADVQIGAVDGWSLLSSEERASILVEAFKGPGFSGLRTERHLYVEDSKHQRELYDLQNDPYELDNLLADWDGHAPAQSSLDLGNQFAARLQQMKECAGDRCRPLDTQPL